MSQSPKLRRLLDLPGVADLELAALMKPLKADPDYRAEFPEIDECSLRIFGITADQAEALEKPDGWDDIETKPISVQVSAFEDAGWDVTDNKRRTLRMFYQFNQQLWLAIRGVAGSLPSSPTMKQIQLSRPASHARLHVSGAGKAGLTIREPPNKRVPPLNAKSAPG